MPRQGVALPPAPAGAVVRQLGLKPAQAKREYHLPFADLERELHAFTASQEGGDPAVLPTRKQLVAAGRQDLVDAIVQYGGFARVARRLGLGKPPRPCKPMGYWRNLTNLEGELAAFMAAQGLGERMPSAEMLIAAGRQDLLSAIRRRGPPPRDRPPVATADAEHQNRR